jgi:hypothetical protein
MDQGGGPRRLARLRRLHKVADIVVAAQGPGRVCE